MTFVSHIVPLTGSTVNAAVPASAYKSSNFRPSGSAVLSSAPMTMTRGRAAASWFSAALAATLTLAHPGYDTSEGTDHVRTALHWLETGSLGQAEQPAAIFVRGTDGLFYPADELGNILWVTPGAAAGLAVESLFGRDVGGANERAANLTASFLPVLFITAMAAGFWKWIEWGFAAGPRLRALATALLVFATMLLPYARSLSDVVATGAWLTWGGAFAARAAVRLDTPSALLSGLCLGFAFLTKLTAGVGILPIVLGMMAKAPANRRWTLAAVVFAGALPSLAAVMWFNDLRMGSPFLPAEMHPQYARTQPGGGSLLAGIAGLLFSPGKSILLFAPALAIAAAGWPRMLRASRADALTVAGTLALFLIAHGSLAAWHGDWGWGPRYFVFILPILWMPAIFTLRAIADRPRARLAAGVVVAASVAVQLSAVAINWQYQYQVMYADGRLHAGTYWSADNQLTDGIRAAFDNAARTFGVDRPARALPGVSRATFIASTGINVWWVTAIRMGLPPAPVGAAALALLLFAWFAWRRALRLPGG